MGRITMSQGKGSQMHNLREYGKYGRPIPAHIDQSRTSENIVLVDIDVKQAYHDIFDAAVAAYDATQKQPSRRIKDYYKKIQGSKNGEKLYYEDVVQWGSMDDFKAPEMRQKAAEALKTYVSTFEQRNPNLKLIGAYIHMDEASPHLHLDYIPVATGYKKGLKIRNSLARAMKEMGYVPEGTDSRKNNSTMVWKEHERAVFGDICRGLGLEVDAARKARGTLSVQEYKDAKDKMMGGLIQEEQEMIEKIEPYRQLTVDIKELDGREQKLIGNNVVVKKDKLDLLKEQAKAYLVNRKEIESLRAQSAELDRRENQLNAKEQEVEQKQQMVDLMYHRQETLNHVLENSENRVGQLTFENNNLKAENNALRAENSSLKAENSSLKDNITELKERLFMVKTTLTEHIRDAVQHIGAVCKAVNMLKYDRGAYGAHLTPVQTRLIDAISNYASRYARSVDEPEIADDIDRSIGISEGIQREIDNLEQREQRHRNRGWER